MVDYGKHGRVALLELNFPPVNTLCWTVRDGLARGMKRASEDDSVDAIVIHGSQTFIAGADIKEFASGEFHKEPGLKELCFLLEASEKPVVSAIRGVALGGGLEVALSSHYRLAHHTARFGFPEVHLGILPGATGTQRLPRVAGLRAALELISTGRGFGAEEALRIGVVDKVVQDKDILGAALTLASEVAARPLSTRRTSHVPVKGAGQAQQLMEEAITNSRKKSPDLMAPFFCIKAVMASVQYPREIALQKEQEYFGLLIASSQAKALQHAFFSERAAPKWKFRGVSYKTVKAQRLETAAVIGAGTMGSGIAICMLNAGIPVVLLEQNEKSLSHGVSIIRAHYAGGVSLGKLSEKQVEARMSLLHPTTEYSAVKNVDVVVEAVFEDVNVKKEVFQKLDALCKNDTYIMTNTSFQDVDQLASFTSRPDRVLGLHFFSPAFYMRLVEVVRGKLTSSVTIATAMEFAKKIGKVPVLVGNCTGFVANRMHQIQMHEASFLAEEGCWVEQVDRVLEDFGCAMGPFKVRDLAGLDIDYLMRKGLAEKAGKSMEEYRHVLYSGREAYLQDRLVKEEGRLGRKSGKGFYDYKKPNARVPFVDPWTTDYIIKHSEKYGLVRRKITTNEIFERLIYSSINVGFKCLEEGIAEKPEDIDVIWLLGLGWPRQNGGPMFYADMIGVQRVYEKVCYYHEQFPAAQHWIPSKLLGAAARNDIPMQLWTDHITPGSNI